MSIPLALPPRFPLVGLGVASLFILSTWQSMGVMKARKTSKVTYPNLYATEAEAKEDRAKLVFNCTQRAHQNTLENVPMILAMLFYLGLYYPEAATAFSLSWALGRIFYTLNYSAGDAKKRTAGLAKVSYIGLVGLFLGTLYVATAKSYALFF